MHVFISYAKKDSRALAADLEAKISAMPNFTAWMDNELMPASSWSSQISNEIDRCDYFLVLLSPDVNRPKTETQDTSFVLNEISYAIAQRKTVIVAMASQTKVPLELADEQYIDFTQDINFGTEKLLNYLAIATNQPAPKPAAPSRTISVSKTINVSTNTNAPQSQSQANAKPNALAFLNNGAKIGIVVGIVLGALGLLFPSPDIPTVFEDPLGNIGGVLLVIVIAAVLGQVIDWVRMRFLVKT